MSKLLKKTHPPAAWFMEDQSDTKKDYKTKLFGGEKTPTMAHYENVKSFVPKRNIIGWNQYRYKRSYMGCTHVNPRRAKRSMFGKNLTEEQKDEEMKDLTVYMQHNHGYNTFKGNRMSKGKLGETKDRNERYPDLECLFFNCGFRTEDLYFFLDLGFPCIVGHKVNETRKSDRDDNRVIDSTGRGDRISGHVTLMKKENGKFLIDDSDGRVYEVPEELHKELKEKGDFYPSGYVDLPVREIYKLPAQKVRQLYAQIEIFRGLWEYFDAQTDIDIAIKAQNLDSCHQGANHCRKILESHNIKVT